MRSEVLGAVLGDIAFNAGLALDIASDGTAQSLAKNITAFYAIVRCLEIVSEASRRLPDDFKKKYPHIAWSSIAGAGNIYRHNYERVDVSTVLSTVHDHLPALLDVVHAALGENQRS